MDRTCACSRDSASNDTTIRPPRLGYAERREVLTAGRENAISRSSVKTTAATNGDSTVKDGMRMTRWCLRRWLAETAPMTHMLWSSYPGGVHGRQPRR